jgi:hypothetical protein
MASTTGRGSLGETPFLGWVRTARPTISWSRKATILVSITSSLSAKRLRRHHFLHSFWRGPYASRVFDGRESFFMAMYFSVVVWSSTWLRALISVCERPSAGSICAGWAGCPGLDKMMWREMTTVDEASLSAATLGGVVVPAWRQRRRERGRGRDDSRMTG